MTEHARNASEELNEKTHVNCLADSVLHFLGEMCNSIVDILFKIFESVHRVYLTNKSAL